MAIEDNVNLKRDVQDNMDYIEGAFDEIEELWEEAAALSKTISRITELQQRIALAEKTLEYYGRELMNRNGAM